MSRSPNYRLKEDYHLAMGRYGADSKTIPAGSYVRPIDLCYVPPHVLDDDRWENVDLSTHVFCYVRNLGIVPIIKSVIRDE
jgi:hypothetical protein